MKISSWLATFIFLTLVLYMFSDNPDVNMRYVLLALGLVNFIVIAIERATDQICKSIKGGKL